MRTYLNRIAAAATTAVVVGVGFATTAHADEPVTPEVAELCLTLDGEHWIPCDNGPTIDFPEFAPNPTPDPDGGIGPGDPEEPEEEPEVDEPEVDEPDMPAPKPDAPKPASKPASGDSQSDEDSTPDENAVDEPTAEVEEPAEPAVEKAELVSQPNTGTSFLWALVAGVLGLVGLTLLGYGLGKRRR